MVQILKAAIVICILFFSQKYIYKMLWNRDLEVELSFDTKEIFAGDKANLKEVIINRKWLSLPLLKVKFQTDRNLLFEDSESAQTTDKYYRNDVFQVNGRERITRTLTFTGKKRGHYSIRTVDLVASDLFMDTQMYSSGEVNTEIFVFPKPLMNEEFIRSLQQIYGEILSKQNLMEDPFEYRGIREYQPYDEMKSINWKATAKTDDLKVNQKNYSAKRTIRMFLNLEDSGVLKKEDEVEACFKIAAGLAEFFVKQGMLVTCYANGVDEETLKPLQMSSGTGKGYLKSMYRQMARVDVTKPMVDFCNTYGEQLLTDEGQVMTFIIAPNQYEGFVKLMETLKTKNSDFIWLYPVCEEAAPRLPESLSRDIRVVHILD